MHSINSAWFAGPKGENAEWFTKVLNRVVWDYYFWRRNYFPEDGSVISSRDQRDQEEFRDQFEDLLNELLGRLKGDCPFHSPRYAGHMVAEQTLPSIAGYFATMLYNPNNVTSESAPVTVALELEASQLISQMLGHTKGSWSHLCSGGTIANFEALWVARSVLYLPCLIRDVREKLGLPAQSQTRVGQPPQQSLAEFAELVTTSQVPAADVRRAVHESTANISQRGWANVEFDHRLHPVVIVPETHHYCFDKGLDLLGFGRKQLVRIKVTPEFRMDVVDLRKTLDELDSKGVAIAAVVAVMGTTEEGAIDPLDEILQVRAEREASGKSSFWVHADAAYGGYLRTILLPERVGLGEPSTRIKVNGEFVPMPLNLPVGDACDALSVLGEADSVTVDPHKLGYIPYPGGAISFKDARIKPLLKQSAPYLAESEQSYQDEIESEQIGVFSLEGSKPGAVAASVWLSHKSIPLDTSGHGALIRDTIRQACTLHALLTRAESESVTAVPLCEPGSNIVCYALRPKSSATLAEINRLNKAVHQRFSLDLESKSNVYSQSFFVSRTTLLARQYSVETVAPFLERLGVTSEEFMEEGVFLLRSVLMNPWYELAKDRGDDVLSRLVSALMERAESLLAES